MLQVPFYLAFAKSDWPAVPCQWMRIIGITRNCARAFIEKNAFSALSVFLSLNTLDIDTILEFKIQKRGLRPFYLYIFLHLYCLSIKPCIRSAACLSSQSTKVRTNAMSSPLLFKINVAGIVSSGNTSLRFCVSS